MVSCAACGCSSTKNNKALNITFHRFPKCEPRRSVWVRFVSTPGWVPKQGSVLCSQHFSKECFDKSSKLRLRLWPTAVPTIEVHHLKYMLQQQIIPSLHNTILFPAKVQDQGK